MHWRTAPRRFNCKGKIKVQGQKGNNKTKDLCLNSGCLFDLFSLAIYFLSLLNYASAFLKVFTPYACGSRLV